MSCFICSHSFGYEMIALTFSFCFFENVFNLIYYNYFVSRWGHMYHFLWCVHMCVCVCMRCVQEIDR